MSDGRILPLRAQIHPTAIVSPLAQLGVGVEVGPYALVGPGVRIGDYSVIGPHVVISGPTRLGKHNRVFAGALIGAESPAVPAGHWEASSAGQPPNEGNAEAPSATGTGQEGPNGEVWLGDNNVVREYACIQQGAGLATRIGDGNFIMAYVQLGPGCQVGNGTVITHATTLGAGAQVEDNVDISGLSYIDAGVRIGQLAMVGAVTQIKADIPPFLMVAGNPPQVHGINVVGLRRHGVPPDERTLLKRAVRLLYRASRPVPESIQELQHEFAESGLVRYLIEFLQASQRGIFQPPAPLLEFPEGHES